MLLDKTIAVVVPAYNEEKQIKHVLETMPDFVDRIVIINDNSSDNTEQIVTAYINKERTNNNNNKTIKKVNNIVQPSKYNHADIILQKIIEKEGKKFIPSKVINGDNENEKIILINNNTNGGVGAAIARGYKWCQDHEIDCTAVMAGDGQMDPSELEKICRPVIEHNIDYVKGNRLIHRSAWLVIPKLRYFGNSILSILTKVASGYWHVSDTQTGYTAISIKALNAIRIHKIYKGYGMPNDMLVKLNIAYCTIKEIGIKPIYSIGEKTKMHLPKVIPNITWLLIKSFFKRLWIKYLFRDFHPLFLFYNFAFLLFLINLNFIIKIINRIINDQLIETATLLAFLFLFISGFQSLIFAMWMDIQDNERQDKSWEGR